MIQEIDTFLAHCGESQEEYEQACQLLRKHYKPATAAENLYRAYMVRHPRFHFADVKKKLSYLSLHSDDSCAANPPAPAKAAAKPSAQLTMPMGGSAAVPALILQAELEMREAWRECERLQNELYDLGESNSDEVVKRRKRLMAKRDPLMEKYNVLYEAKEHYHVTGEVREAEICAVLSKAKAAPLNPKELRDTKVKGDANLYALKARRHAVVTHLKRLNNQLTYSSDKKLDTPNPMPDCPKRDKYLAKVEELKKELSQIDEAINQKS